MWGYQRLVHIPNVGNTEVVNTSVIMEDEIDENKRLKISECYEILDCKRGDDLETVKKG